MSRCLLDNVVVVIFVISGGQDWRVYVQVVVSVLAAAGHNKGGHHPAPHSYLPAQPSQLTNITVKYSGIEVNTNTKLNTY